MQNALPPPPACPPPALAPDTMERPAKQPKPEANVIIQFHAPDGDATRTTAQGNSWGWVLTGSQHLYTFGTPGTRQAAPMICRFAIPACGVVAPSCAQANAVNSPKLHASPLASVARFGMVA